jgi:hypothetical protein
MHMRWMPAAALAVVSMSCVHSHVATVPTAPQCAYEIVQHNTSPTAEAFLDWLKPQADDLFGGGHVLENGDVFIADLNNDGTDEYMFAWHEGSGSYLNVLVFRRAGDQWAEVDLPFEDQEFPLSHEYRGPLLQEDQLVGRLCGKTIINLMGGIEPNYFPQSWIWEGNTAKPLCSAPWLTHHRAAAADLVKRGMLDEARVLLNGVQNGCEKESPAEVRAINEDIAVIAKTTASASAASYDFSWMMSEVKKHPSGQLVLDPRFGTMLMTIVPDAQLEFRSLRGEVKMSVWLPDDPKIIDDRYIVISGCEPHNCGNKGFVWIDTKTKQGIAMTGGMLTSKTTAPDKIPEVFWEHTLDAVGEWTDEDIEFIGPDGKRASVKAP